MAISTQTASEAASSTRSRWPRLTRPVTIPGAIERGLVSSALASQVLWFAADPTAWQWSRPGSVVLAAMVVAGAAWVALLISHFGGFPRWEVGARWADIAALVVIAVGLFAGTAVSAAQDWAAPASWALLPAALTGLLLPGRFAAVWLTALLVAECGFVFGFFAELIAPVTMRDLLFPAYTLAVGVICIAARRALVLQAESSATAARQALEATNARMAAEGRSSDVHREERVLHETVLNTLVAIVRGRLQAPTSPRESMRARCAEAAQVLRSLQSHSPPLPSALSESRRLDLDLRASLDRIAETGPSVRADCDPLPVSQSVYEVVLSATREALSNVLRHARAHTVTLTARATQASGAVAIEVTIRDDGRGFDVNAVRDRYGVSRGIVLTMAEIGGTADISSRPGEGTIVTLAWSEAAVSERPPWQPTAGTFAIPVLACFAAFAGLQLVIGWEEYTWHAADVAAYAIFVAAATLLAVLGLRGLYSWPVVILVCALSPVIYELQMRGLSDSAHADSWVQWSSSAIAALFIVLGASGPSWSWVLVIVTWLAIQGDGMSELLAPSTVMILAGALLGRSARRNAARVRQDLADEDSERRRELAARDDVGRLKRRYSALRESRAAELMEAISEGRTNPTDPSVPAVAAIEERFIRTIVRVDPSVDEVHALATELAVTARRAGVILDVDISSGTPSGDFADARESLTRAVRCAPEGGTARFSARAEGDEIVLRLVAPIAPDRRADLERLPVRGIVLDPSDPDDWDMLWEVRQPRRCRSRTAVA